MGEAPTDTEPDDGYEIGDASGRSSSAGGSAAVAAQPAPPTDAESIQLPTWTKVLGWFGAAGLIYLLICAVSIISRGFAGLGSDAAHSMFASPGIPGSGCAWVSSAPS